MYVGTPGSEDWKLLLRTPLNALVASAPRTEARIELTRFGVFQGGDPHNPLLPGPGSEARAAARDFGWLANDSGQYSLIPTARGTLTRQFPEDTKAANEFVCWYYEANEANTIISTSRYHKPISAL
jgi:hypothetical protein